MQTTSALYQALILDPTARKQVQIVIAGVTYGEIGRASCRERV